MMATKTISGGLERYALTSVLSVLSILGTVGNVVVLYVFSRPARHDRASTGANVVRPSASATVYVMALAAADLVTSLLGIPSTVYMEWVDFYTRSDVLCKLYQFLIMSNIPFSALIIVAIAVDRYVCICHPLRHSTVATACKARVVVGILAVVAIVLGLLGSALFSVYHRLPIFTEIEVTASMTPASADDEYVDDMRPGILTDTPFINSDNEHVDIATATCTTRNNQTNCSIVMNTGFCGETNRFLSAAFVLRYEGIHSLIYLFCLLVVSVLYSLIYRSVLVQKARRQRLRSSAIALVRPPMSAPPALTDNEAPGELIIESADDEVKTIKESKPSVAAGGPSGPSNQLRLAAHIRTAAMLFVVTVVFLLTFAPASLMALKVVSYNRLVFNLYFINNVANPVIYSFMNSYFRRELNAMFCQLSAGTERLSHAVGLRRRTV